MAQATTKKFLYLVQSRGALPEIYRTIESAEADLLRLTFKEQTDDAIFFPKSTWTEGRNRLLQEALARGGDYLYYIFIDEDIDFEKGGWRTFEQALDAYQPAVATPYYPRYRPSEGSLLDREAQTVHSFDAMFNAFHRDVIHDRLLLPYYPGFDKTSWWYSNMIVIALSQVLYKRRVLQINSVWIKNTEHGEYPQEKAWDEVMRWVETEVVNAGSSRPAASRARQVLRAARVRIANFVGEHERLNRMLMTAVRALRREPRFTVAQRAAGPVSHRLPESEYRHLLKWDSAYWRERRGAR
ncbi:MAG TPA: hypothetical protein VE010_14025 [Thermoanaerobaculia bacterium]|nr:hypothetical protein [Thermoanaerobaculia bacterium]